MLRGRVLIGAGLLALIALASLSCFLHYVPFDAASYAAWLGIGVCLLGLACVGKPLRWMGIRSRRRAALVMAGGLVTAVVAVCWPTSVQSVAERRQRLDDFLSEWQFTEYHEGRVRASRERVVDAVRHVSFADMPAAVFLMRLRALAGGELRRGAPQEPRPVLDLMAEPGSGFLPLDTSDPGEIVYGMAGRPWTNEPPPSVTTPEEFLAFREPGQIRVAFNIRIVDEGSGVLRVSTETRTLGNDAEARRVFARYWRLIYPGSAIIRRVWLDAIIARAERQRP